MKRIAIVGGGASAAYAILACEEHGIKPDVYIDQLRVQPGAFWLKWLPERLENSFEKIMVMINSGGTREEYIKKQWENPPKNYKSSFPETQFVEWGYSPQEVLYDIFRSERATFFQLDEPLQDSDLLRLSADYNAVFHTFPSTAMKEKHKELLVNTLATVEDGEPIFNSVYYNGIQGTPVVRESFLFGHLFIEFAPTQIGYNRAKATGLKIIPFKDLRPTSENPVIEQLSSDIFPLGRLAQFDRHLQSHDSYATVKKILNG